MLVLQYGRDVVPMLEDDLKLAEFNADPGMKALGFVAASSIPRHYFMSVSALGYHTQQIALLVIFDIFLQI